MAVEKLRDISEATTPFLPPLRPENLRSAFALSETARRFARLTWTPGIHRFRSLQDAQRARPDA